MKKKITVEVGIPLESCPAFCFLKVFLHINKYHKQLIMVDKVAVKYAPLLKRRLEGGKRQ